MSQLAFKHSIKVPRFYKCAARILMEVKGGGNLKTLVKELNHPVSIVCPSCTFSLSSINLSFDFQNKRGVMALVLKTLQYSEAVDKLFTRSELLKKEPNMNENLASVLVTELLWGKRNLEGDSKPVQTILKYQEELFAHLNSGGIEDTENIAEASPLFHNVRYYYSNIES